MKKFLIILMMFINGAAFCQQGGASLSTAGNPPHPSAGLDVNYNNKGFLMPRLTTAQMAAISAPATSLMVFNTDSGSFYYYNGSVWTNLSAQFLPTVLITTAATSLTPTTAASGGGVSSNGGAAVTAYGVCWGAAPNPVLGAGNFTTDGTGTGMFTSSITGLTGATVYYLRAYATNAVGTAYGPQITFTTPGVPTVVSTAAATSVTSSTAISGGDVASEGGETVTAFGVCWSTSANPV